jgi:hypothetical protein
MIPYATSIKYMIGGYSVIFAMLAIYLISLIVRWRRMKRDLQTLEQIKENLEDTNIPK